MEIIVKNKHRSSLKIKILTYLAFVLCTLLILVGSGVSYFTYLAERNAWQKYQGDAAANAAYHVASFLNNIDNALTIVSYLNQNIKNDYVLDEILESCPSFSEIIWIDNKGAVITTSSTDEALFSNPYTIQQANWFLSAREGKKYISDVQIAPDGKPYLIIAIPAPDKGIIVARINMKILTEVVNQIQIGESNQSYIIDSEKTVIASSNTAAVPVGTELFLTAVPTTSPIDLGLTQLGLQKNYQGQTVISSTAPIPGTNWIILTETQYKEALSKSKIVIKYFCLGMVLFSCLVLLGTIQLLNSLFFKPLETLRAGSQQAGAGNLGFQIKLENDDEIGKLASSFNEMIVNLKNRETMLSAKTKELALEVNERKKIEEQLIHDAYYDTLTNLPNRALIVDRLKVSIARSKRNEKSMFAVLFLDLDRFKVINDSLGHNIGDKVLIEVAKRLKTTIRESDTLARFGGDEFIILLEDVDDIQGIMHAATHILSSISQKIIINKNEIYTSVCIGIVTNTSQYEKPEEFLRDADIALYRAKKLGQSRYAVFDPQMHSWAVKVQKTEADLRNAIENDEFVLFYQPVLALNTGKILGFEALIRWQHPQHGILIPGEFIPIAEDTDIIIKLGNWVLMKACRQLVTWSRNYPSLQSLTVSVNMPGKHLNDPGFIPQIKHTIKETGINPSLLILEITERSLLDLSDNVIQTLADLKSLGVSLHLDDFGTGYSSLSVLHEYPIDCIKIDRSFIHRLSIDDSSIEIVRAILHLGNILNKEVITEGIETKQEIDVLISLGCCYGQGYYFSHPDNAENMESFLKSHASC